MTRPAPTAAPYAGIGFPGLLALLFIGLKLTGYITWPWLWVLCPVWIPILIGMILLTIASTIVLACTLSDRRKFRQRQVDARRREEDRPLENEHGPAHRWGRHGR